MKALFNLLLLAAVAACVPDLRAADTSKPTIASHIEVKFLVRGTGEAQRALKEFGLKTETAEETMDVAFFDTPTSALFKKKDTSIILRLRLKKENGADKKPKSTVKLRAGTTPLDAAMVTDEAIDAKREKDLTLKAGDATQQTPTDSYSIDAKVPGDKKPRQVMETGKGIQGLFSDVQWNLARKAASPTFDWESLVVFGPVESVHRWEKQKLSANLPPATVEHWVLPARKSKPEEQLTEFSVRILDVPEEIQSATEALKELMKAKGFELSDEAEAKTRLILEHFAP